MDSSSLLLGKYIIEKKQKNTYLFVNGKEEHANIGGAKEWGDSPRTPGVHIKKLRIFSHYGAISEGKILATSILPRHFYLNNEDFAALLSQGLQLFT